ncbi:DUF1513 domain-containing protein [Photobacterium japonica]|uniref:DUF1513 domain-containing protein n=1 Tax=Photobacterium japonica TaxID=2910235 RepID=UPI003D0F57B1
MRPMVTDQTRRRLLKGALGGGALASIGSLSGCLPESVPESAFTSTVAHSTSPPLTPASATRMIGCCRYSYDRDSEGRFAAVVADSTGQRLHQFPLPARGHGIAIHPNGTLAAVFARRPGQFIQLVDVRSGQAGSCYEADSRRHYYGHGVFSPDGQWLYASEGVTATSEGVIGVYRVEQGAPESSGIPRLTKAAEWSSIGIGPHEVILADAHTLAIAVGGVHTQGRTPLNLNTMQPALVYVNRHTGAVEERATLPDHRWSIRHLSVTANGQVVCGQQYRGDPQISSLTQRADESQNESVTPSLITLPLIAVHQRGEPLRPLQAKEAQWQRFQHYIASVACHDGYVLATSPRGNCYGIWHVATGTLVELRPLTDVAGVSANQGQWWLSSGSGKIVTTAVAGSPQVIQSTVMWDNHWNII